MPLTESPRQTTYRMVRPTGTQNLVDDTAVAGGGTVEYRSTPGRGGARESRRIEVSSSAPLHVELFALIPTHSGMDRIMLSVFDLFSGVPLIWPVPSEALGHDVLVVAANEADYAADIHIADHWR